MKGGNFSKFRDFLLCLFSAGLLVLAFPKTDLWICAWGGLIPLMFALDGDPPAAAFRRAYLCGLVFFAGTLSWFFHLTRWFSFIAAVGVVLLFLYLAVYFGMFGLAYSLFSRRTPLVKLFLLPSVWVVLEFVRGRLFTGFDWAALGHSQYKNLPVIQIADMTGVAGVSFAVVMVNVFLKEVITERFVRKTPGESKTLSVLTRVTAVAIVMVLGYGVFRLFPAGGRRRPAARFSVAVIQANIPQEMKWQETAWPSIMEKHIALSGQAARHDPALIIWPETSFPGNPRDDKELFRRLQGTARRLKIPLLFGAVTRKGEDYYNSAVLLSKEGDVVETYRKVHLVPFGEYIPLRSFLPFLSGLVPIGDFTAGNQWTTFPASFGGLKDGGAGRFSVLICFEDTVARLSRRFVRGGARLLVNMTNDAWFGDTKAPFMHLQSAVFRTVENRRALVRAANTGVSCFIDRWGRIVRWVEGGTGDRAKKTYVNGYAVGEADFGGGITFYTKFGDVFTIFCFGCILGGILWKEKGLKIKGSAVLWAANPSD